MDNTAKPAPPVNRPQAPRNQPRKPRPSRLSRLRKALANAVRRADELLESGYRFELSRTTRARIDVIKPGHTEAAYHVDFLYNHRARKWSYKCDCEAFRFAESAQQWDVDLQPDCKHGRRAMSAFLGALQVVEHIRPLPPLLEGEVARAQLDPTGPQPRPCLDASNPWPTKRAVHRCVNEVAVVPAWDISVRRLLQS